MSSIDTDGLLFVLFAGVALVGIYLALNAMIDPKMPIWLLFAIEGVWFISGIATFAHGDP